MFVRHGLLRSTLLRDAEGGAGGGGEPEPAPAPVRRPAPAAEPAPSSQAQRAQETAADLRATIAAERVAARQTQASLDAALAEVERTKTLVESARTTALAPLTAKLEKAHTKLIDATLMAKMTAAGLQDPDLVVLAAKMPNAPKITLNDDFEVDGVDAMVDAFKKWKPDFFRAPTAAGAPEPKPATKKEPTSAGGEPSPSAGNPVLDARKMSKEDYAKFRGEQLASFRRAGAGTGGFGR